MLLLVASLHAQNDSATLHEGFDKPLKTTVLDFGPSPFYNPSRHIRNKLMCYYYSAFTVKEYEQGEKGAEWLSIVPSADAECTRTHSDDERLYNDPVCAYFWGVKGTFAFFEAAE